MNIPTSYKLLFILNEINSIFNEFVISSTNILSEKGMVFMTNVPYILSWTIKWQSFQPYLSISENKVKAYTQRHKMDAGMYT